MRRRSFTWFVASVIVLALAAGCAATAGTVPNVVGKRLDLAESEVKDAGLEFEEVGGGVFGILRTSNWFVCAQQPAPGTKTTGKVKLIVERVC